MYNTLLNDFEEDGNSSTEAGFRKVTTEEEATETPASENAKAEAVVNPPAVARQRARTYPALLRLEGYLKRNEGSSKMKRTALASLLWWSQPPVLDAVEGRYRKHTPRDSKPVNEAIARLKPVIMGDNELREVLLSGVPVRGEARWLEGIAMTIAIGVEEGTHHVDQVIWDHQLVGP